METSLDLSIKLKKINIESRFNYAFTKSTTEKLREGQNLNVIGKQLLYVPIHSGSLNFRLTYKNTFLSYQQQIIGQRQTTRDNNPDDALNPYQLAQLLIGSSFKLKKNKLVISLKVNNLWNENYQVVAFQAMPPRHFSLSLFYDF